MTDRCVLAALVHGAGGLSKNCPVAGVEWCDRRCGCVWRQCFKYQYRHARHTVQATVYLRIFQELLGLLVVLIFDLLVIKKVPLNARVIVNLKAV